jgi:excisionase family DNA binding protein
MTEKKKKLLSVKDAAEALELSEQRIKQLIYEERLKAEKVGNQWIILESDLQLVENRQTGRPSKDKNNKK